MKPTYKYIIHLTCNISYIISVLRNITSLFVHTNNKNDNITIILYNINIYIGTACVTQLAKASDTQAVGHGFDPRPDH